MGINLATSTITSGAINCMACRGVCVDGVCTVCGVTAGRPMDANLMRKQIVGSVMISEIGNCHICGEWYRDGACQSCEEREKRKRESEVKNYEKGNKCVVCSVPSEKNVCQGCARAGHWECSYCTFVCNGGNICEQCCKTNMNRPRNRSSAAVLIKNR